MTQVIFDATPIKVLNTVALHYRNYAVSFEKRAKEKGITAFQKRYYLGMAQFCVNEAKLWANTELT